MAHRRRAEVEQRVVVGPLALDAAEAEALGRQPRWMPSIRGPTRGTARVLARSTDGELGRVQLERRQPVAR